MLFQELSLSKDDYREQGNFFGNASDVTAAKGKTIYDYVSNATFVFCTSQHISIVPQLKDNVEPF